MPDHPDQLAALAPYLAGRREAIMQTWRHRVTADPKLTTGTSLPRAQLNDHLPALLQDFERRLAARDAPSRAAAVAEQKGDAAAHGLHRWQQGFDLSEVARELGRLNECVVAELDHCAVQQPGMPPSVMAQARAIWAELYSVAIGSSTSQYFELQQLEAAGEVAELERALTSLRELEAQRAALWQQAAHDLRGNLGVVALATAGLASAKATLDARDRFLGSLDRNVRALHALLEDVTSLARLQGGQEHRAVAEMDAARLLRELAEGMQAAADERQLRLTADGPAALLVDGDAVKVRRIVHNLVLNAIKYTHRGGVAISWGESTANDAARWFIQVSDTGPGLHPGKSAALAGALEVASDQAKEIAAQEEGGDISHVQPAPAISLAPPHNAAPAQQPQPQPHQQQGEGIGLSIVKRLCGLLDATLEVESKVGEGTTLRVLLPKQYEA